MRSDALVFFGATGDLAYKQIFPALQGLVKRGQLNAPIVGVAKSGWNLDQLRARARESLQNHCSIDDVAWKHEGEEMLPYERLLGDAMDGDAALFNRSDAVDAAWRVIEPVLSDATPVHEYECGSRGPEEAGAIASDIGGWHNPLPEEHCHDPG